jgi:phosphoenolpyruvate carboxykinase (ATP)
MPEEKRGISIPDLDSMTIENFIATFHKILEWKKSEGRRAYYDNPNRETLRAQAQFYGEPFDNGSLGWSSNIWSRSKANTEVIEDNSQLHKEHKLFMRCVLEYVLASNPLIKVDGTYGQNHRVRLHARVWVDAKYPDLPLRWRELTFSADPDAKPDVEMLALPGLWCPATVPGSDGKVPLFMIRFPEHWFTVGTVSSYQGEIKKSCLSHWIYHAYKKGGTGIHASSRQMTVKAKDGEWKKVGMVLWGLTGSGKSTHGMYVYDDNNEQFYNDRGIDVRSLVKDQYIKNDDVISLFEDGLFGGERGSWTKMEKVTPEQPAIYAAGMSPRALHENTGVSADRMPDFLDDILQYRGIVNCNARTVMSFEDMRPNFDGSIDVEFPPNMAVFISPGFLTDYAWLKIADADFAAAVLAAGRTIGHPAQSTVGIGEEKFVPLFNPFIIGKDATNTHHVHRFRDIVRTITASAEVGKNDPLDCYLINTTGAVGTKYVMKDGRPAPVFEEVNGKRRRVGGADPAINETELFFLQAARGLVEWGPHPIWGEKVLCPLEVPGIPDARLKEFDPFHYRTRDEMVELLKIQLSHIKAVFDKNIPGLDKSIRNAMDF